VRSLLPFALLRLVTDAGGLRLFFFLRQVEIFNPLSLLFSCKRDVRVPLLRAPRPFCGRPVFSGSCETTQQLIRKGVGVSQRRLSVLPPSGWLV